LQQSIKSVISRINYIVFFYFVQSIELCPL
jgi:hypothetical protein